jgi:hypothetical protein
MQHVSLSYCSLHLVLSFKTFYIPFSLLNAFSFHEIVPENLVIMLFYEWQYGVNFLVFKSD